MSVNIYDSSTDTLTRVDKSSGALVKTSVAKTGTDQSAVTDTIAASTTMDNAIGTLLNNDVTLESDVQTLTNQANNKVLYLTGIACSATTGNFTSYSNSAITADHVLAECVFTNPSRITSDVTWETASGSLVLNGTCSAATTVNVVLVKKDN